MNGEGKKLPGSLAKDARIASWVTIEADGTVSLITGTHDLGTGHATPFAQILCDRLGVPFESVRLIMGDTDRIPRGQGTHGSRSMMLAGPLIAVNSDKIS